MTMLLFLRVFRDIYFLTMTHDHVKYVLFGNPRLHQSLRPVVCFLDDAKSPRPNRSTLPGNSIEKCCHFACLQSVACGLAEGPHV